ncbi:hypothetical protein PoB_006413100 [Plakobranchus ocellatus]|uniref:Uncharacterized protein n=1 Tax=Plakobranchus ocellatus TaxID=259542 RepID=A0AAV4D0N5_9GAST|nr:hypothetical protein PoB_006413100 [Plakobranchus ocellatus]
MQKSLWSFHTVADFASRLSDIEMWMTRDIRFSWTEALSKSCNIYFNNMKELAPLRSKISRSDFPFQLVQASPEQGDLKLSGLLSGQGADGEIRTRDRRVYVDLSADSSTTVPPTP